MIRTDLIRDDIEYISKLPIHPVWEGISLPTHVDGDTWRQHTWAARNWCGTGACLAGWHLIRNGYILVSDNNFRTPDDTTSVNIKETVAEDYGLDRYQSNYLFHGERTIEEMYDAVECWERGEEVPTVRYWKREVEQLDGLSSGV